MDTIIKELTRCRQYCITELNDARGEGDAYFIAYHQGQLDAFDKSLEVIEENSEV